MADAAPSDEVAALDWDATVRLPEGTNSQSFLRTLDLALGSSEPGDAIYLLEQDYLHVHEARGVMLDGLGINSEGYVTLFDDPLYYWTSADVVPPHPDARLLVGTTRHWRTAPSTTMTFAAPVWVLGEDRSLIRRTLADTVKPPDRLLWRELRRAGRDLRSCLPAAATHVETTALAPFVDWQAIALEGRDHLAIPDPQSWRALLADVAELATIGDVSPTVVRRLAGLVPRGINTLAFERPCIHARRVAPRLLVYRPAGYARSARLASAAQDRSRCVTVFLPRST